MKPLVIGLGSMGKRRIRCLKALGIDTIVGLDPREDRRLESAAKYQIETVSCLNDLKKGSFDAVIVSSPPDKHDVYIDWSLEGRIPCFVEASVIVDELPRLRDRANATNVFVAPSCTLMFHPSVRDIFRVVRGGFYGKVVNWSYHTGQYLPDWHPWEKVSEFYVSNPRTGGCREIVPFEFTWLGKLFGLPRSVKGTVLRTMDVGAPIDDTYGAIFNYGDSVGMLTVDVVSRYAVRQLIVNMERGQLHWRWDEPMVKVFDATSQSWAEFQQSKGSSEIGYNDNIPEAMYIAEVDAFLKHIYGTAVYPTDLNYDIEVLNILKGIESDAGISI